MSLNKCNCKLEVHAVPRRGCSMCIIYFAKLPYPNTFRIYIKRECSSKTVIWVGVVGVEINSIYDSWNDVACTIDVIITCFSAYLLLIVAPAFCFFNCSCKIHLISLNRTLLTNQEDRLILIYSQHSKTYIRSNK